MNENVMQSSWLSSSFANKAVKNTAHFWFACAVIGQWWMVFYLMVHFGGETLAGNFKPFTSVSDQLPSMVSLFSHILLGALIMIGGPLQLIPQIRQKAPTFHRWNGRIFSTAVTIATLLGLYLIWTYEKMPGGTAMLIAMNTLVIVILTCMFFAIKYAVARKINLHRRWALRLFMAINAGWFFRVGLMAWVMINQAPVGFDPETFEGPFVIALAFAQFIIPLAVLEWYLRVKDKGSDQAKLVFSATLFTLTLIMGVGIAGAGMTMWAV